MYGARRPISKVEPQHRLPAGLFSFVKSLALFSHRNWIYNSRPGMPMLSTVIGGMSDSHA